MYSFPRTFRALHGGADRRGLPRGLHTGRLSLATGERFSLRWFRTIADYPEFINAFWISLWLGAISSLIAPLSSRCLRRSPSRAISSAVAEALSALFLSPLMIPHVVLGIAFLRFFTQIGVSGTFPALLIAHVVIVPLLCG